MTDNECFLAVIAEGLSPRAKKLFSTAKARHGRYEALLKIAKRVNAPKRARSARLEAARIKAIIDFELQSNKDNENWTFRKGGLAQVTDDFFLLNEHLASSESDRLNRLCTQWGRFSLGKEDQEEINRLPEAERDKRVIE